jgi:hypothetical protein
MRCGQERTERNGQEQALKKVSTLEIIRAIDDANYGQIMSMDVNAFGV